MNKRCHMLKLYIAPKSITLAPLILLEEVEADYTISLTNFSSDKHNYKSYRLINPIEEAPSLVTAHGVLTETPAIMTYIAQEFGSQSLVGAHDPYVFDQIQEFNSYLASTVDAAQTNRLRGSRWTGSPQTIESLKLKASDAVTQAIKSIEKDLGFGEWVMGDAYTICDPYLYNIASWLEDYGVDITSMPNIIDHSKRISNRQATRAALSQFRKIENLVDV